MSKMIFRYLLFSLAAGLSLALACVLVVHPVKSSIEQDEAKNIADLLPVSAEWTAGKEQPYLTYTLYLPWVSVDTNNLLKNGNFELPPPWPFQDGLPGMIVAPHWHAWYLDLPPSYVQVPSHCNNTEPGCYWARPEFYPGFADDFPQRVHSGSYAQRYFSFGRMHEAGLYQQVSDLAIGSRLSFSVYMKAWMCLSSGQCNGGSHSDASTDMHLRVGIDPTGGTNPFGQDVIWSPEMPAWDTWTSFQVETVALSNTVTIFTHSRAEWDYMHINNDVYIDDARLIVIP